MAGDAVSAPNCGGQRFAVRGQVFSDDDPSLQEALARIHDTAERPRCLCVRGGVEMYVAKHRRYLVKRMPETGNAHHPSCPSYEPDALCSGLGELAGDAILEGHPGRVELCVDFPWVRISGCAVAHGMAGEPGEVGESRRRMSLRAVMHFLFERAGFNRWIPAMAGRRNQGVLCKYLLEASAEIGIKGVTLAERLYVPEPFHESGKVEIAQRRREKLSVLRPRDGHAPLALVVGEFKVCEPANQGRRVWIRHMPDAPLLISERSWERMARVYAPLLEARDADTGHRVRVILAALIRTRREFTYEIDAGSMMLVTQQWIPIEGVHELPLIEELIAQQRRFFKPLRYDALNAGAFANVLLLDAGPQPVPLHVVSAYGSSKERLAKEKAVAAAACWAWWPEAEMPSFPARTT